MDDPIGTGYIRLDNFSAVYGGMLTVRFVVQLLAESTEGRHIGNPKTAATTRWFAICKYLFGYVMLNNIFETLIVLGRNKDSTVWLEVF